MFKFPTIILRIEMEATVKRKEQVVREEKEKEELLEGAETVNRFMLLWFSKWNSNSAIKQIRNMLLSNR